MTKICDLHTHVLPQVDDGAKTTEQALLMLRNAVASDVVQLALTPHFSLENSDFSYIKDQGEKLIRQAADLPITLVLGAEVRLQGEVKDAFKGRLPTLNGSRYLLGEFLPNAQPREIELWLKSLLQWGYVPLIAHPERYGCVAENPALTEKWLDMGCHLQLTGGSILGAYGQNAKKTAEKLLQMDLVACVASDAHGVNHRSNYLLEVYDHLSVYYSSAYAKCLMYTNPMAICADERI